MNAEVIDIAKGIAAAGGRAILVGGCVRDALLEIDYKDYDFEIYGLHLADLEEHLAKYGDVIRIGRSFGVLKVKGLETDIDFSIPRRDSKIGRGHRGFIVDLDPDLTFEEASRRRDLTMNSLGLDPLTDEILDPHGGRADLERGVLRATDEHHFSEDPLRGLRVAQFAARYDMQADEQLIRLCSELDLSELPGERLLEEFRKLLLLGCRPSVGFEFLRESGLLQYFPELDAMVGVPQDPIWHPEGTVWEHTLMVVDEAACARTGNDEEDLIVLFGAVCHDLGKPATTVVDGDRVRSPNHEEEGVEPSHRFLERLRVPNELLIQVSALVRHHLAPAQLVGQGATPRAYRRLARKLGEADINARILHRVAEADHFGRGTPDALAREFPAGDAFLEKMSELEIEETAALDVVLGRHLIARGMKPGREFGKILDACREVQYETGWDEPEKILNRVLDAES